MFLSFFANVEPDLGYLLLYSSTQGIRTRLIYTNIYNLRLKFLHHGFKDKHGFHNKILTRLSTLPDFRLYNISLILEEIFFLFTILFTYISQWMLFLKT